MQTSSHSHPGNFPQAWQSGDPGPLSRAITILENGLSGQEEILHSLPPFSATRTIGITGPPGAGKSSLTDALIAEIKTPGIRIAVLAVDPSSPFHSGSLLGDRIRMSRHFNDHDVYIRSLSSRGWSGGLSPRIIEISDLMRSVGFDWLFIETVGVGQGEVDIAGLADSSVVVLSPGGGDGIQAMKAGLMEIADIFVVNKADLPGAGELAAQILENLQGRKSTPVISTIATSGKGVAGLAEQIRKIGKASVEDKEKQARLLAIKAWRLIRDKLSRDLDPGDLQEKITHLMQKEGFNLYRFVEEWSSSLP